MSEFNDFENQQNEISSDSVSGVESAPKKKKGAVVAGVTAGVIAVVGGGSAIAYNTSDLLKNKVKLATLSPEKYYAWVNEENSSTTIEQFSDVYSEYVDTIKGGKGANANMKLTYTMSDGLKNLAKSVVGDEEAISFIDNIKNVSLNLDETLIDGKLSYNMGVDFNDTTLANLEMFMDYESLLLMGRVPQITEKYLGFDYKSYMDSMAESSELPEFTEDAMMKLYSDPESIITKEEFENLAEKYVGIWSDSVSEVKQEKSKEVTVGEYTNEYTVLTVDIDEKLATEIAENYITAVKEDETVKDIVVNRLGICDESTYSADLEEALEEVKSDSESDSDLILSFETYVDAKGQIRGWTLKDNDGSGFECIFTGEDEENANGVLSFNHAEDGTKMVCNINNTCDKDVYTGDVDISITTEGETVTASVEYNDIKITNEEYGYCEGNMNISVMDSEPFVITLSSDGSSQKIACDIDIEDVNYGNVELEISSSKAEEISMPNSSDAYMIDMETADLSGYATEEELMNFLVSLIKNVGLAETDEDAMTLIESMVYGASYGNDDYLYEDDYYDDYYDDYDYDYDYSDEEYVDFDSMTDEELEAYLEEMYDLEF